MALSIDLVDGFGFLDSDSELDSKIPTHKQPISPVSESSSGISSLDSDDLKKQLLSSPPTIPISHEQDDEDQQTSDENNEEADKIETYENAEIQSVVDEKEAIEGEREDVVAEVEEENDEKADVEMKLDERKEDVFITAKKPIAFDKIFYGNREILDLGSNLSRPERFLQYTVLPENNLNCFFQNRAQYWRLGNPSEKPDTYIECVCCDFMYPSIHNPTLNPKGQIWSKNANPITDSLLTFLKNHHADYNNAMPNSNTSNSNPNINMNNNSMSHTNSSSNNNNTMNKRMYNNNAPYAAYQMIQQQQQQYQNNNGYYNNNSNNIMNGCFNQQMNAFNSNGGGGVAPAAAAGGASGGYNNTALALLNLMNSSRNITGAFQAMNNNSRYYNNNNNNINTTYGLYKQF